MQVYLGIPNAPWIFSLFRKCKIIHYFARPVDELKLQARTRRLQFWLAGRSRTSLEPFGFNRSRTCQILPARQLKPQWGEYRFDAVISLCNIYYKRYTPMQNRTTINFYRIEHPMRLA